MQAIFQPDIFSVSTPRFRSIADGNERAVRDAMTHFYRDTIGDANSVRLEQFGGNEINSNNFRLTCADAVYLLKRLPLSVDARRIERQLKLVDWLRDVRNVRLPALLRTQHGAALGEDGRALWCLFEFLDGDFFAGGLDQLVETGREIGRLQVALRLCPMELQPLARWAYFTADDAAVYQSAIKRRGEWSSIFGPEIASVLEEQSASMQDTWGELAGASAELSRLAPSACHCDLHPHNLLLRGTKFAGFIDFESFVAMPVEAALGFATFKLMRQHAVSTFHEIHNLDEIANATSEFLTAVAEFGEPTATQPSLLRAMALAEVFRRILVIFRLNLRDANSTWNHVLPMHLAGLRELNVIFGYDHD